MRRSSAFRSPTASVVGVALAALVGAALLAAAPAQAFEIGFGAAVNGSGHETTQARSVSGFDAVRSQGSIDVIVRQGATEGASVTADDNIVPLIETRVVPDGKGHALVIDLKHGVGGIRTSHRMQVTVTAVQLHGASVSGSGDLRIQSLKTPALAIDLSGSGDAHLDGLQADDLALSLAGSGDIDGGGRATRLKLDIAGSGDARLGALQADDVKVSIAGSGDADVVANREIAVSIAGSGDVTWRGDGKVTRQSVVGSGSVRHR
jgi:hypothetical protein